MKKLGEEDQRHVREGLTEEELALYDIVLLPDIELSEDEKERIKIIVRKILATLKKDKLRSDWHTKQQTSAQVRNVIKGELREMPSPYLQELNTLWERKFMSMSPVPMTVRVRVFMTRPGKILRSYAKTSKLV